MRVTMQPHKIFSTLDWIFVNIISGALMALTPIVIIQVLVGLSAVVYNSVRAWKKYCDLKYEKEDRKYVADLKENINKEEINKRQD
jgi:ferritin-like protein